MIHHLICNNAGLCEKAVIGYTIVYVAAWSTVGIGPGVCHHIAVHLIKTSKGTCHQVLDNWLLRGLTVYVTNDNSVLAGSNNGVRDIVKEGVASSISVHIYISSPAIKRLAIISQEFCFEQSTLVIVYASHITLR